jgi:hypothetical protein
MLKGGKKRALPSMGDLAELLNQTLKKNARIPVFVGGQFVASTVIIVVLSDDYRQLQSQTS